MTDKQTRVDMIVRKMAEEFERVLGTTIKPEQRATVERSIMEAFGGERVYIPKGSRFVLGEHKFDMSGGVHEVMRRYSIGRTKAYELMRKK